MEEKKFDAAQAASLATIKTCADTEAFHIYALRLLSKIAGNSFEKEEELIKDFLEMGQDLLKSQLDFATELHDKKQQNR
jgi:hypothetical protein